MKLFKSIDEKFAELGFLKVKEDYFGASYERRNSKYRYTQVIDILHKANGKHIVQSYDKDLQDARNIGNTCVGLTVYEMRLCIKKMRQLGWKITKN